ncbi:MAG TPA: class I SAM-dependent methyltransferase [Deltaproteobacteria bacterium]|nr:class I SAM-dependent methyltransferase [Deltaproteobacteria bacterium]HPJ93356.1 class I SAM-dependent methyltransferase [Deltaproteobacteria bacterium]HPR52981.1 class I SAM-dependent methyltransferase [Deltaproteobacteria bacterium]
MMIHDHTDPQPAGVLLDHAEVIRRSCSSLPALDLACGIGRNGIYLARQGMKVVFADISFDRLNVLHHAVRDLSDRVLICRVDMEKDGLDVFKPGTFGAVLVFRYLHRPLIPFIKDLLAPGGILVYETFTVDQPKFGKPTNPDFLLNPGELEGWFGSWEVLHRFEGVQEHPRQAVANIVCRKPE